MIQKVNRIYKSLFVKDTKIRYLILMGGRGAGRSTVASQLALSKLTSTEYYRCAIMRYVLGDIRNSIYREILDRAEENEVLDKLDVNEGVMSIKYGVNSINAVGFRKSSGEQKSKLKSLANYNCVIVEEADEINEDDFMQLDDSLRTIKGDITIILLLNCPPKNHWIIKRWFDLEPIAGVTGFFMPVLKQGMDNVNFIRTSFKDNIMNMSADSVANYHNYEITKPDYYYNMIAGYVPETVRGRIYKDWKEIAEIPHEAKLVRRGLDFGFSNDPAAIVDIYKYNGEYILDERLYKKELKNRELASFLLNINHPDTLVVADSSEPKSIAEIEELGVTILGAKKQKQEEDGSKKSYLNWRIAKVQDMKISFTSRSKNLKIEYENYAWMEDKEGNGLNIPIDKYNHLLDALGYGLMSMDTETPHTQEDRHRVYENRLARMVNDTGV